MKRAMLSSVTDAREKERVRADKAAATRAANVAAEREEETELAEWDRWHDLTLRSVPTLSIHEVAALKRPEKPWHVIVYGAGRHANIAA